MKHRVKQVLSRTPSLYRAAIRLIESIRRWRTKLYFGLVRLAEPPGALSFLGPLLEHGRGAMEPFVPVRVQLEQGVSLELDPYDYVTRCLLESGGWQPATWEMISEHLRPGGTFVDVGSHIGYYSLKAARVVGASGQVVAFEPNPQTATALLENLRRSKCTNVRLLEIACSNNEGQIEIYAAPRSNTGKSSFDPDNAGQGSLSAYTVRMRRLDDVLEESSVGRVDVIKVDVEGAELLALQGATRTLERHRPALVIEVNESLLNNMNTSTGELEVLLSGFGYTECRRFGEDRQFVCMR